MDEARFNHLVAFAKAQLKSPAKIYQTLLADRQRGPYLLDQIAESETSRVAWDSLCEIARDLLREGRPLPEELAQWVAQVLDDLANPPPIQPRPPRSTDAARKRLAVYGLIYHFVERFGLNPTRAPARGPSCCAEGGSACDVVGAAAGLTYKNAEKYWNERDGLLRSYWRQKK